MQSLPSLDLTRLRQSCCLGFSSRSAPPPVEIPLQVAGGGCNKKLLSGQAAGEAAVRTSGPLRSYCHECSPQVSLRHKVGQTVLPLQSSGGKEERQGGESLAGNKQGGKDSRIEEEIREGVGWSPASTAWGFLRASPGQGHK